MKSQIVYKILIFSIVLMSATAAFAQSTGSLSGVVNDPNGAVVQGRVS
ncbi:MAG: hypothetical protein IPO41_08410 [Acidobacteria bacterium]|nr:hypothetical protein [Acidobacteriota bacterium]